MKDTPEKNNPANGSKRETADQAGVTKPADYLRAARTHLRNNEQKKAFVLLQQAAVQFPDEPVILSYFGCLQALVDKKYRSGIETCKRAFTLLKGKEIDDVEKFYPLFYLNLGRAYLAAKKKQDAINAFTSGLKYDRSYSELLKELRGLGVRKQPPIPLLGRSNPINKYIGLLLHKDGKNQRKGGTKRTT